MIEARSSTRTATRSGAASGSDDRAAAQRRRHVGHEARVRVARLDRSAASGGRPAGGCRPGREPPARCSCCDSDDREPVQARRAPALARARPGALVTDADELPDRPLRARRARRARVFDCGSDRRADRRRRRARVRAGATSRSSASPMSRVSLGARSPTFAVLTDAAHDAGALVLLDALSHSAAGVVPIELESSGSTSPSAARTST